MGKVLANVPRDWGSIQGQVISRAQKMVLDPFLLNTLHYKVCLKGKVEESRESSSTLSYFGVVGIEKGASGLPLLYGHLLYLLTWRYNCL